MPRLKLTLEYDGTDYSGWQIQANARSFQEALERALSELLGEPVATRVAGRTDAGVHALGQVACFDTLRELPLIAYTRGLNGLLPPDIAVREAEEVAADFDPRHDAKGKTYRYLISNRRGRSPLRRRSAWEIFVPLNESAMRSGAEALLGEHDFTSFRAADCQAQHARRTVTAIDISRGVGESEDLLTVEVSGNAFLKHMVRNIVGSLVEVGKGRRPPSWLGEVLAARDRTRAGPTAPPQGLTLVTVRYGRVHG